MGLVYTRFIGKSFFLKELSGGYTMKIQNRLKAFFMAARIEYHWRSILRDRKRGDKLLARGAELNCERMLRLNRRMMYHGLLVRQQETAYEAAFLTPMRGNI